MSVNIELLSKYIKNIEQGNPINLAKFKSLVDQLNLEHEKCLNDIQARKQKGQLYVVTHINKELVNSLTALTAENGRSRAEAARQNRSHSRKVNGSFIIVREGHSEPGVVMIDSQGQYRANLNYSSNALIIENRQNFIDIDAMFCFLSENTSFIFEQSMNVIFSEGNAITNSLHQNFLSSYTDIYLCLDFDLGGLRIANNLMTLLPDITFYFLVPDDIEQRLEKIIEVEDEVALERIVEIGLKNERLAPYAKIMKDKQKTLEQEGYLND